MLPFKSVWRAVMILWTFINWHYKNISLCFIWFPFSHLNGLAVSLHDLLSYPESLRVAWSCCDELFLFYALWMWHSWRSGCGRSAKLAGLQRLKGSAPAFSSLSETNQDYWAGCSQKSSLLFIHSARLQLKVRHKWLLFVYAKMGYFCFVSVHCSVFETCAYVWSSVAYVHSD